MGLNIYVYSPQTETLLKLSTCSSETLKKKCKCQVWFCITHSHKLLKRKLLNDVMRNPLEVLKGFITSLQQTEILELY